ncbi:MAG TPA: efflux transporter periplasmic adaptor subunit [Bacteroidales bacterium]|nr:efflux transporter periplasmic adaptor subunit [Bacteroidales bacterium]
MKTRAIIYLSAAIIAVSCNSSEENKTSEPEIPVSVSNVTLTSIEKVINTNGTVYPMQKAEFKSEISGVYKLMTNPISGKKYRLGDLVKTDEVIVSLEDPEYENSIAIESKKLNLDIAEQEYTKQQSLFEKGGVTQREMRNAEVSYTNAKYDYENSKIKLSKMKVASPFGGVIVDLPYYTPNVRIATTQPLFTVMDYGRMYMEVSLPEKYVNDLQSGMKVRLTSYNLQKDTIWGIVADLSPAISAETRTFKGRIDINNPNHRLKPGMFVNADIVIAKKENAIVVPKELVLRNNDFQYVFVIDKSIAKQREVSTGIENGNNIEITSGLSKDDRLVVKGYETLKDNSKVRVIK